MAKTDMTDGQGELKGMRPEHVKELEKLDRKLRRLKEEKTETTNELGTTEAEMAQLMRKHADKLTDADTGKICFGDSELIPGKDKVRTRKPREAAKGKPEAEAAE